MGPKFGLRILAPKNLGAAPKFGFRENLGEAQKNQRKKYCKVKMRNEYSVFWTKFLQWRHSYSGILNHEWYQNFKAKQTK